MTSFPNAKVSEQHIQHFFDVDVTHDSPQLPIGHSQFFRAHFYSQKGIRPHATTANTIPAAAASAVVVVIALVLVAAPR